MSHGQRMIASEVMTVNLSLYSATTRITGMQPSHTTYRV